MPIHWLCLRLTSIFCSPNSILFRRVGHAQAPSARRMGPSHAPPPLRTTSVLTGDDVDIEDGGLSAVQNAGQSGAADDLQWRDGTFRTCGSTGQRDRALHSDPGHRHTVFHGPHTYRAEPTEGYRATGAPERLQGWRRKTNFQLI